MTFEKDQKVDTLKLHKQIHDNSLLNTWIVHKQEKDFKRPMIALFLKYTSTDKNGVLSILNTFCENIDQYNQKVESEKKKIRLLPCIDNKAQYAQINDNNIFYWLFERPIDSFLFGVICNPDCAKERVCRYKIRGFIKAYIKSKEIATDDPWYPRINLSPHTIYFGKVISKIDSKNRSFVGIPFPNLKTINDLDTIQSESEKTTNFEEFEYEFGKFIISMFSGFDKESTEKASQEYSISNSNLEFKDTFDLFEKLNPNKNKILADEYFGLSKEFVQAYQATEKIKASDLMKNSFYDFVMKLLTKEFKNIEEISKHPYLSLSIQLNRVRSDTLVPNHTEHNEEIKNK